MSADTRDTFVMTASETAAVQRVNDALRSKLDGEKREKLAIQFASDMLRAGNNDVDAVECAAWKLAGKFVPYALLAEDRCTCGPSLGVDALPEYFPASAHGLGCPKGRV
jgi:hypothetical protein